MFNSRRYLVELGAALSLYAVLLVSVNLIDSRMHPEGGVRMALALVPMIGAVAGAWAILRALWQMDELQRRIQYDAIAIAFLGTALFTFGWGFAEGAGAPLLPTFAIWPIMGTLWVIGQFIARRRYS